MIKLLVIAVAIYLIIQLLKKQIRNLSNGQVAGDERVKVADEMVKDPECNVYVPKREAIREQINGKTYYFCSPECRDAFIKKN